MLHRLGLVCMRICLDLRLGFIVNGGINLTCCNLLTALEWSLVVAFVQFLSTADCSAADLREPVLALLALEHVHVGVHNLNAVRHVARIIENIEPVRPFELMNDGDL